MYLSNHGDRNIGLRTYERAMPSFNRKLQGWQGTSCGSSFVTYKNLARKGTPPALAAWCRTCGACLSAAMGAIAHWCPISNRCCEASAPWRLCASCCRPWSGHSLPSSSAHRLCHWQVISSWLPWHPSFTNLRKVPWHLTMRATPAISSISSAKCTRWEFWQLSPVAADSRSSIALTWPPMSE